MYLFHPKKFSFNTCHYSMLLLLILLRALEHVAAKSSFSPPPIRFVPPAVQLSFPLWLFIRLQPVYSSSIQSPGINFVLGGFSTILQNSSEA